jgi:hypothetical protein
VSADPGTFTKGNHDARAAVLIGVALAGIHAVLIGLPTVNLEYAFTAATRYLAAGRPEDLELFQNYQANTFGIPMVALVLHKLAPFFDWDVYPRLATLLGIPILVTAMYGLGRSIDLGGARLTCAIALCLLNPLVWVFAGRGTADFLPVAVGMSGLWVLWAHKGIRATAVSGFTLGVAMVLKYHAFVFAGVAVAQQLFHFSEPLGDRLKRTSGFSFAVILIPATYLISVHIALGFWLTPDRHHQALGLNAVDSTGNFSLYATYAFMLMLPLSLVLAVKEWASVNQGRWLIPAAVLAASVVCGYLIEPREEMNFGPLNQVLSQRFLAALALAGAALLGYVMVRMHALSSPDVAGKRIRAIVYGIALFLVALSFTRPAERYLIMILPLGYLLLLRTLPYRSAIVASALTFPIYIGLDAYSTAYQIATGQAASSLTMQLESSQLLPITQPGAVEMHTGDKYFAYRNQTKKYRIVEGRPSNAIMTVEKAYFGGLVRRSYSLVPGNQPLTD